MSNVGVRASWHCCLCQDKEHTYQLETVGSEPKTTVTLRPPPGWTIADGSLYCGHHFVYSRAAA